ncbi:MAG TPA: hypothetical protein VJ746_19530 [Nitrospira sp.]|nr:hypothetical protein [Nitrospira sp.]
MKNHETTMVASQFDAWRWMIVAGGLAAMGAALFALPVHASSLQVPWECSNYSEEAQTRCINGFIEHQREQIQKLEGQLQAQHEEVGRLKNQLDRQAASTANPQQQLSQPPATTVVPAPYAYTPYAYTYAYPPVGLGLYLGRPWIYGPPYFYHPYWGPRFYGHWGRRW